MKDNEEQKRIAWNKIVKKVLQFPGVKVHRETYLKDSFRPYLNEEEIEQVLNETPKSANIDKDLIDKLADASISYHTTMCSSISFAAGMPGGWWALGPIPGDVSQFFYHATVLCQKLLYLYGWPTLFDDDEFNNVDDDTLLKITLFLGVMMGAQGATKALSKLAENISKEVVKRLPRYALTKYGIYNLAKQVGKWIGAKITKESFAKQVGKVIPVLGGFISGIITYFSMKPMGKRLKKHLKELPLAN